MFYLALEVQSQLTQSENISSNSLFFYFTSLFLYLMYNQTSIMMTRWLSSRNILQTPKEYGKKFCILHRNRDSILIYKFRSCVCDEQSQRFSQLRKAIRTPIGTKGQLVFILEQRTLLWSKKQMLSCDESRRKDVLVEYSSYKFLMQILNY